MNVQKCPNCSANMLLVNNSDGTTSFKCEYCGTIINNRPKNISEKVMAFVNKAVNAVRDDDPFKNLSPEKREELQKRIDAANEKQKAAYERYIEKKVKMYERYAEKRAKH